MPCLATWAPAAAASTQAPVEMLTDPMPSPPVPTMSNTAGGMTLSDSETGRGQQKMPCKCPGSLCGLGWRPPDFMEMAEAWHTGSLLHACCAIKSCKAGCANSCKMLKHSMWNRHCIQVCCSKKCESPSQDVCTGTAFSCIASARPAIS